MLEGNGLQVAAISYDSREILAAFAQKHSIRFPLLSDPNSQVIRRFGIFNFNMAPDLRAHGVPHPVGYLVTPEGTVVQKYFVENYQHRVTGSAVALRQFGAVNPDAPVVTLESGALAVRIGLASKRAFAGEEVGLFAQFALQPGWHIYGAPVPAGFRKTDINFAETNVVRQRFELPPATMRNFPALKEILPVYHGSFQGTGTLLLKYPLPEGRTTLQGRLDFQQCSDTVCEHPQTLPFELVLTLEPFVISERDKKR